MDNVKINIYLAKKNLLEKIQDEEGFIGVGITTESEDIKSPALVVLVQKEDSPVIEKLPRYFGGYKILHRTVGDVSIQELGLK